MSSPSMSSLVVEALSGDDVRGAVGELSDVLIECVEGGASVGFLPPVDPARAAEFWTARADEVEARSAVVLVARVDGRIEGTVQLQLARPQNQPHRADVAKLLVHPRARRRGLAAALMTAVEAAARAHDRRLLVLDTLTGSDAARLYRRLGWQETGEIPDYAMLPDGSLAATTVLWKRV